MNETRPGGPTVLRMILGRQLQALREKAGMSYDEAAEAIYTSSATVRRMERAEGALKPLNVKSLLMAYGITDVREIDAFLALARDASKPGWWHSYDDVLPSWFRTLIGLEEAASLIRGYDPHSVPGLLQTPGYARANVQPASRTRPRRGHAAAWTCGWPASTSSPGPPRPGCGWSSTRPCSAARPAATRSCASRSTS